MARRLASVIGLAVGLAACGGGGNGGNPAGPSPQGTKVIFLEGNMDFGDVDIGNSVTRNLRIYNQGNTTLTITGMTGPGGFTSSWTSGTVAPNNGFQELTLRFSPTENRSYNGTLTVSGDFTSGTNTKAIIARGLRELFRRSGSGDSVFDMPLDVARVRIVGTFNGSSSNFVVRIGGRLIVNELLGTFWGMTRYDGVLLTGGGGVVAITLSSGVSWSFEEQR